jgi:hypothetical protein
MLFENYVSMPFPAPIVARHLVLRVGCRDLREVSRSIRRVHARAFRGSGPLGSRIGGRNKLRRHGSGLVLTALQAAAPSVAYGGKVEILDRDGPLYFLDDC